jgi:hypothetical protein
VQDQEEIVLQGEGEALPQPAQAEYDLPLDLPERRDGRAQEGWAGNSHPQKGLAEDARGQPLQIDDDVGELGHRGG